MGKLAIIHFQPLEKYPPITNLLDHLADKSEKTTVISTKNTLGLSNYSNSTIRIIRYLAISEDGTLFVRLFQYLIFYIGSMFTLLLKRPNKVLYYETLSSLPAIIYYYLSFKKIKLLVHYHEYSSPEEYRTGMFLTNWFHLWEQKIYPQVAWLSHTNNQRMELFIHDNPNINRAITRTMPNYPPMSWRRNTQSIKPITFPLKIVYVGSVSLKTMYFPEFINWVTAQQGKVLFDVYSFEYSIEFKSFIEKINSPYVALKGRLDYKQFPVIMKEYNVGLILYKAHIPNVKYCASNKLFEYYACGLDVWVSEEMIGSYPYATINVYPKILFIAFNDLSKTNLDETILREGLTYRPSEFYCENIYEELSNFLIS